MYVEKNEFCDRMKHKGLNASEIIRRKIANMK